MKFVKQTMIPTMAILMVATAFAAANKKKTAEACESSEVEECTGHDGPSADGAYGTADCEGFSFTLSNVVNAVEHSKRVRRYSGEGECPPEEELGTASEEIVPGVKWSATLADAETISGEGASAFVARGDNMSASCTFTLSAEMPLCGKTIEVSYGAVAVLDFALSVACEPNIVGQDRTGDPESEYEGPSVVAEANIEPDLPCIEGVEWFCTCDEGRSVETDWSYTLAITNREAASESWMDNEAKASAKGKSAAAQFTILKLDVEIGGQGEKDEHETGAFLKHVQDVNDDGLMSEEGTNAMVAVSFRCWPEDVPEDIEVEVENSGPGELYEKLPDDTLVLVTKTNYPASGISEREFWLHGHEKSGSLKDGAITIQIESIKAKDEAYYTSVGLDVAVCDPDKDSWPEIDVSRVVLDDEVFRVKCSISPKLRSAEECRRLFGDNITISTLETCPGGVDLPIGSNAEYVEFDGRCEFRIEKTFDQLKQLGLLPQDDDSINEMSMYDVGDLAGTNDSYIQDSEAFSALGYAQRGFANNEKSRGLTSEPPISRLSRTFLQAAGCEVVYASYSNVHSRRRQLMNQADYFYYSGHGLHKFALMDDYEPSCVKKYWNKDIDCVIVAGCSILDIGDRNNNFIADPEDHYASPGLLWSAVGPSVMLGYNHCAPLDSSGAPVKIVNKWLRLRGGIGSVNAWLAANDNYYGHNACTINRLSESKIEYHWFQRNSHSAYGYHLFNTYKIKHVEEESIK